MIKPVFFARYLNLEMEEYNRVNNCVISTADYLEYRRNYINQTPYYSKINVCAVFNLPAVQRLRVMTELKMMFGVWSVLPTVASPITYIYDERVETYLAMVYGLNKLKNPH